MKAALADMGSDADKFIDQLANSVAAFVHQGPAEVQPLRNQNYINDIIAAAERDAARNAPRVMPIPPQPQPTVP